MLHCFVSYLGTGKSTTTHLKHTSFHKDLKKFLIFKEKHCHFGHIHRRTDENTSQSRHLQHWGRLTSHGTAGFKFSQLVWHFSKLTVIHAHADVTWCLCILCLGEVPSEHILSNILHHGILPPLSSQVRKDKAKGKEEGVKAVNGHGLWKRI